MQLTWRPQLARCYFAILIPKFDFGRNKFVCKTLRLASETRRLSRANLCIVNGLDASVALDDMRKFDSREGSLYCTGLAARIVAGQSESSNSRGSRANHGGCASFPPRVLSMAPICFEPANLAAANFRPRNSQVRSSKFEILESKSSKFGSCKLREVGAKNLQQKSIPVDDSLVARRANGMNFSLLLDSIKSNQIKLN